MNIKEFLEQSQQLAIEQSDRARREEVDAWRKIADDLAFALDCLVDDKDNMKYWFRAHDALKRYEDAVR